MNNYVKYILTQFNEKGANEIIIKSIGDAMYKVATIAEIIKYRVKGLHQINQIGTQEFEDIYEPKEEGLDRLVFKRNVTSFTIILTKNAPSDKKYYGY